MMKKFQPLLLILALVSCLFLTSCSDPSEVNFVSKYHIDLSADSDISAALQKAIDELPDGGTLFLEDGTYPLEHTINFKENMTLKLHDNAILLNRSAKKNPIMALNHPMNHSEARGSSNITLEGGIWDLNGQLDESESPIHLPQLESVNALGFGYASNVVIRNITFRDCLNGHVMQFAAMDNVLVENCRFEGQWFKGNGNKTRELIQIEPGSVKGYPYILVQEKRPTTNVTIHGCYFGGSKSTEKYLIGIGTHSQQAGVKCSDILIENCTFDNPDYAAIHFMAYDRMTIRSNTFNITDHSSQTDRYGILADTYGSFLDPSGADSTTELVIEGNKFQIDSPSVTGLSITTSNKSPKRIQNVTIQNNEMIANGSPIGIYLYLIEQCHLEGNTMIGFESAVTAKLCEGQILSDTEVNFIE